jgi:hypothetical protein
MQAATQSNSNSCATHSPDSPLIEARLLGTVPEIYVWERSLQSCIPATISIAYCGLSMQAATQSSSNSCATHSPDSPLIEARLLGTVPEIYVWERSLQSCIPATISIAYCGLSMQAATQSSSNSCATHRSNSPLIEARLLGTVPEIYVWSRYLQSCVATISTTYCGLSMQAATQSNSNSCATHRDNSPLIEARLLGTVPEIDVWERALQSCIAATISATYCGLSMQAATQSNNNSCATHSPESPLIEARLLGTVPEIYVW